MAGSGASCPMGNLDGHAMKVMGLRLRGHGVTQSEDCNNNATIDTMSKQSEAKEKQGYAPKAIPQTCGNCAHFTSQTDRIKGAFGYHSVEKELKCSIGGFAVKKMGTCDEFTWPQPKK